MSEDPDPLPRRRGTRSRRDGLVRAAFVLNADQLGSRVVSGASYTFLGTFLRMVVTLGSVSVLARILAPADFGYIAMATVVTEFAALFSNFGLVNILIQRRTVSRLQLDTVFWASALVGAAVAAAVFALSYAADLLFSDAVTGELLRVLCLAFLLGGLTTVHDATLARLMRFRTEFRIQIVAVVVRAAVAILFAYLGFGVWSLVAGALASSLAQVLQTFVAVPYLPRFRFHYPFIAATWRTSGSYLGRGLLFYADTNVDLVLIGRYLGATALGFYQNSRSLTDEIRGRIAVPLQRVLFPAFAALQVDRQRLQDSVVRSGRLIAALVVPIGFGTSAIAADLVPVLYGPQWTAMIPVVVMLGVSAGIRAATSISGPIFNATDHVTLALKVGFVGTVLNAIAVALTLSWGVAAVSAAIALTSLYSLVVLQVGLRLIGLNFTHAMRMLGPPFLAASVMWATIAAVRPFTMTWVAHAAALLPLHIALGALVYAIALHACSREYFMEFKDLAARMLRKR